jgi:hypothetical protein
MMQGTGVIVLSGLKLLRIKSSAKPLLNSWWVLEFQEIGRNFWLAEQLKKFKKDPTSWSYLNHRYKYHNSSPP